jgi:uncharacterized membrane protein YGL010W
MIVMPILAVTGFFPTTGLGLIGYGMSCVGLMTLTYGIKELEDRLSVSRFWGGIGLVVVGWITGFVQL